MSEQYDAAAAAAREEASNKKMSAEVARAEMKSKGLDNQDIFDIKRKLESEGHDVDTAMAQRGKEVDVPQK